MKTIKSMKNQHGFFAFGLGMIILAVSGATTGVIVAANDQETAIVENQQTESVETSYSETEYTRDSL